MDKIKMRSEKTLAKIRSLSNCSSNSKLGSGRQAQPQDVPPPQQKSKSPRESMDSLVSSITTQLNNMLIRLQNMQESKIRQIQDKVQHQHSLAKLKHGDGKYFLHWGGSGVKPSSLQEQIRKETDTLIAQINKEKARLAILLITYKQQEKKTKLKKRLNTAGSKQEKIHKTDCLNEPLMDRIKAHLNSEYSLGECTIMSKIEQQTVDIENLKAQFQVISMDPEKSSPISCKSKFEKKMTRNQPLLENKGILNKQLIPRA